MPMRMVLPDEWNLEALADPDRRKALLNPLSAEELIAAAARAVEEAASAGRVRPLVWEPCNNAACPRHARVVAQIAVEATLFDQLFNGRSGYRAQYYLSEDEGVAFNRTLVDALSPAILRARETQGSGPDRERVEQSLKGVQSKIWVVGDEQAFDAASENTLRPPRWLKNTAGRRAPPGLRVPLPEPPQIDLKGTFVSEATGAPCAVQFRSDRGSCIRNFGTT